MEQKTASNGGPDRPARNVGSRKRARAFPKGRQLDVEALREVRELLGSRPRRPDLLIEFLHLIQDRYHYLSARHLRALCDEMRLPQAAVYEVATFYSHFDVVKEGETPPPPTTIRVCDSITCALKGAEALLAALKSHDEPIDGTRTARALHGPMRYRAGLRNRTSACRSRHASIRGGRDCEAGNAKPKIPAYQNFGRVSRSRRLFGARELPLRRASFDQS